MKASTNCPVFDSQSGNSGEFRHVSRDHSQIVNQGDGSNLQIHRSDDTASGFKIMTKPAILIGTAIIEWKRDRDAQRPDHILFPGNAVPIFFSSVHQFRPDRRTHYNFCRSGSGKFFDQSKILPLENFDPDIGIEKISHHQVFAGGSGNSGGSSNSKSAQQPMISAKSGRLLLSSSRVGSGASGTVTEEIASRTRVSNVCAASGFRCSKTRSSSKVIPLMRERYRLSSAISIHKL